MREEIRFVFLKKGRNDIRQEKASKGALNITRSVTQNRNEVCSLL